MECNEAKKPQVLYMILTGRKLADIAAELDISVRSIQRWLEEPEFADAVREEHQAACRIAIAQARTEMACDLEEGQRSRSLLVQIRNDEKAPIHARIRCAALLMARADRWTNQLDKEAARETSRESAAAAPRAQKSRQKMTDHDTAAASVQKPRQKTTESDTLAPKKTKIAPVQPIADSAESIVASLMPSETAETLQNTTKSDTNGHARQSAIHNPKSAMPPPPSQPLQNLAFSPLVVQERERAMARLKGELQKLDQLEQEVIEGARSRNIGDTDALREFKGQIAASRAKLIETIVAIDESSPQDFANAFKKNGATRAS